MEFETIQKNVQEVREERNKLLGYLTKLTVMSVVNAQTPVEWTVSYADVLRVAERVIREYSQHFPEDFIKNSRPIFSDRFGSRKTQETVVACMACEELMDLGMDITDV